MRFWKRTVLGIKASKNLNNQESHIFNVKLDYKTLKVNSVWTSHSLVWNIIAIWFVSFFWLHACSYSLILTRNWKIPVFLLTCNHSVCFCQWFHLLLLHPVFNMTKTKGLIWSIWFPSGSPGKPQAAALLGKKEKRVPWWLYRVWGSEYKIHCSKLTVNDSLCLISGTHA